MMSTSSSFLPNTDAALLAWSLNFKTVAGTSPGPTGYGLTSALLTSYGTLHDAYAAALAACDPAIRTKGAVSTKNAARSALKADARLLAKIIDGTGSVTNAQKLTLGLTVKSKPAPIPPPSVAPNLAIVSVNAWTVKIKLQDATGTKTRGRPAGVSGAAVFSFVGDAPPADIGAWQFEGNTGKTLVDVPFPNTLAAGTKVFLTSFWFNGRKQSGPACTPVGVTLQGGGVSLSTPMAQAA